MTTEPFTLSPALLLAATVGAAAGYLGAFMVLRRMALVGDALTHVALPGIGLGLTFHFNPFIGGFAFLVVSIFGIWGLQRYTHIYSEALIGLFFTVSLALGVLFTPQPELLEALFGDITAATFPTAVVGGITALAALLLTHRMAPALLIATVAPELAQTQEKKSQKTELLFLLLVALIVALGIRLIGTLLMGALVIIPAITAKNLGGGFRRYATASILIGTFTAAVGVLLASVFHISPGVAVVFTNAGIFLISLPFRRIA